MSESRPAVAYVEYGTRPFRAILVALFLAGFAVFSSLYCVQPMMPFVAEYFAVSPTQSSFPLSFSTMALAFSLIFAGMLSDRYGRKPIMVFALFSTSSLLLISAMFPHWSFFLATRILLGLSVSGVASVAMTYIGEEIAQKDVGYAMGLYISGTAIGGMSGRLIAGVLLDFSTWQVATLIIGCLNLGIAMVFYWILPASKHFQSYPMGLRRLSKMMRQNLTDPKLRLLFVQGFILMGCFVSVYNYISYHLLDAPYFLSQTWIGLISIAYLSGIYSSPRAAAWGRKYGRENMLPLMILCMLASLWIMQITSIWSIVFGLLLFSFSFFAAHSTVSSWVAIQSIRYGAVGSAMYLFCYYFGSSVLGSFSGLVWERFGWIGVGIEISAVLLLGIALALQLYRITRQEIAQT